MARNRPRISPAICTAIGFAEYSDEPVVGGAAAIAALNKRREILASSSVTLRNAECSVDCPKTKIWLSTRAARIKHEVSR